MGRGRGDGERRGCWPGKSVGWRGPKAPGSDLEACGTSNMSVFKIVDIGLNVSIFKSILTGRIEVNWE